jgi:hypothetical protein
VLIKKQSENLEYQSTTENGLNLQSLYMCMTMQGSRSGFGMAAGTPVVERPTLQDMIPGSIPSLILFEF